MSDEDSPNASRHFTVSLCGEDLAALHAFARKHALAPDAALVELVRAALDDIAGAIDGEASSKTFRRLTVVR